MPPIKKFTDLTLPPLHSKQNQQVGAAGITPAVLRSTMDVLGKRGFVRMRCGIGGAARKKLARELAALLDAEAVHDIGHTVTLYRAPGLARPAGCSCSGD
jgi:RNA-binding protein YhbY